MDYNQLFQVSLRYRWWPKPLKSRYILVSIISRMCVSCPGYIASHPTDNVHAMQGVRPFCGLISHFFPAKIPSWARVHFRNWPCHLVLWTVPSVTISISKPLFSAKFHKDFKLQEILLTRSKGISNFKRELGIEVAIRSFQVNKNHESIV